jgi:hypothetical protein
VIVHNTEHDLLISVVFSTLGEIFHE